MKLTIYSFIYLFFFASISLTGQVMNRQEIENGTGIKRNALYNLEEIKVRWKKAALENCPGVPCVTTAVPGAPTAVVATAGNASASVVFVAPTNNGGSAITGYTVTSNPDNITATGATSPINVTGLTNGTAYTFTVVSTNAIGNSVASAASTAVTPVAPNTVPGAPTAVVATAGNASASVVFVAPTNNGGSVITGYTVTSNPGNITATGATSPINVTGLTNGTAYTFTVVATNAVGNSVASAASTSVTPGPPPFTCGTSTVSDIDGNAYNTVLIGNQCWTKENLKVTSYNNNDPIPDNTNSWNTNPTGARTEYVASGVTGYVGNYGYLYNWYAVNDSRNICPAGWHVPTDAEWTIMIQQLDNTASATTVGTQSSTAGTLLKKNDVLWTINIGTNTRDFSGLPGGFRGSAGSFFNIRDGAFFWSATEIGTTAWLRLLYGSSGNVNRGNSNKSVGASVRCLRD